MDETLDLPNGETVTTEDVFLFENYPYRFVPDEEGSSAFELSPLYWGGGQMDVPFADRDALVAQWGPESRGTLSDEEWRAWLREARDDDRFDDAELDAVARELGLSDRSEREATDDGLLARIRRLFGG